MKQRIITNAVLLLSLAVLTACPSNNRNNNPAAVTPQAGPAVPPAGGASSNTNTGEFGSIKAFQCEFEGQRSKSSKYLNSSITIPKTVALISLDGTYEALIDLRTKFLGLDFGKFGKISMQFVPAAKTKSKTDTIILIDEGLNKNIRMSQSGFAGQEVKLEAQDESMSISIACKGTSQFKSTEPQAGKTKLVCRGKSSTAITNEEQIDVSIPLSTIQAGEEFAISEAVSAKLDNAATTITYMGSLDPDYEPTVTSAASLKSAATFRVLDLNSPIEINVTCKIE